MTEHDQELEELRDDIDRRSAEGGSTSAEELAEDAQRRHREAQGATSPAQFKDPATVFMQRLVEEVLPGENPEDGRTAWDHLANPHAMKMVLEAEKTGEPLFCFRARDFFSIQVIAFYANIVEQYGPDDANFHMKIVDALGEFKEWQKDHIGEVRYPD